MSRQFLLVILALCVSLTYQSGFLTYVEPQPELLDFEVPSVVIESAEFAIGLNEGFSFFNNLAHQDSCVSENDKLVGDIVEIYNIVSHISKESDFAKLLTEVIQRLSEAYNEVVAIEGDCQQWGQEVVAVFNKLASYVKQDNFIEKLSVHLLLSIGKIKDSVNEGINLINAGNYQDAGRKFGETAKMAFFWNFKN
jgi:hypothetical protein